MDSSFLNILNYEQPMDLRKLVFGCTLTLSVLLELYVRLLDKWSLFNGTMDSVMHFFWGLNVFFIFILFFKWTPLDALLGVFVWQMAWEAVEMIGDQIIVQTAAMLDHFFFDGIKDTIVDLAGGLLGWGILKTLPAAAYNVSKLRFWMTSYFVTMLPGIAIGSIISVASGASADVFATAWIIAAAAFTGLFTWKRASTSS
jgi:hypothetical protein